MTALPSNSGRWGLTADDVQVGYRHRTPTVPMTPYVLLRLSLAWVLHALQLSAPMWLAPRDGRAVTLLVDRGTHIGGSRARWLHDCWHMDGLGGSWADDNSRLTGWIP